MVTWLLGYLVGRMSNDTKTDLAEAVGASLDVMKRDSKKMRGDGPTVFAQAKEGLGKGVDEITKLVLDSWKEATKPKH